MQADVALTADPPTGPGAEHRLALACVELHAAKQAHVQAQLAASTAATALTAADADLAAADHEAKQKLKDKSAEMQETAAAAKTALLGQKKASQISSERIGQAEKRAEVTVKRKRTNAAAAEEDRAVRAKRSRDELVATTVLLGDEASGFRVRVAVIKAGGNSFLGTKVGDGGDQHLSGDVFEEPAKAGKVLPKTPGVNAVLAVRAGSALHQVRSITAEEVLCVGPNGEHLSYPRARGGMAVSLDWLLCGMAAAYDAALVPGAAPLMPGKAVKERRPKLMKPSKGVYTPRGTDRAKDSGMRRATRTPAETVIERIAADPGGKFPLAAALVGDLIVRPDGTLWCVPCNQSIPHDKWRAGKHLELSKHADNKTRARQRETNSVLDVSEHRRARTAQGSEGATENPLNTTFRVACTRANMKSFGTGKTLQSFRSTFESIASNGETLTDPSHMASYVEVVTKRAIESLKVDPKERHTDAAGLVSDFTTLAKGEWGAYVARTVTITDLYVVEELVLLPQLSHHAGGLHCAVLAEVARLRMGLPRGAVIAMMQDRVASNGVMVEGLRQLDSDLAPATDPAGAHWPGHEEVTAAPGGSGPTQAPPAAADATRSNLAPGLPLVPAATSTTTGSSIFEVGCVPHTLSHVGEQFETPELDTLNMDVRAMLCNSNQVRCPSFCALVWGRFEALLYTHTC
jgi:hypothetical protein